jgi:hypothetical protein
VERRAITPSAMRERCRGICVARAPAMKLVTKLVITGSLISAAALVLERVLERGRRRPCAPAGADLGIAADLGDPGDELVEEVSVIATSSGIADVDPEPLAQTAGEGIPIEPVEAAHTEIEELRERLPRPGKGV